MNFSYNPDFYPTPENVINRMMMGEDYINKTILEPSAGSGNIVRWLQRNGAREVLACETDTNLQQILQRTGCRMIGADFLTVTREQVSHVDMIVMNPPFSQGVRHICHAYEIAPAGCCIIALCNTSNLESTYSRSYREFQELVKMHGYSENMGECFEDAERVTRCRVSLIKIWKDGQGADEFKGYFSAFDEDEQGNQCEGLMQYNFVRDIVNRYIQAVKLFDQTMQAAEQINRAAEFIDYTVETDAKTGEQRAVKHTYGALPITFKAVTTREAQDSVIGGEITHLTYKRELQKYYWRIIFQKLNMAKFVTKELREQINRFIEQRQNVPFTMGNIYRVVNEVIQTNGQRMRRAIVEAFDLVCKFSAENVTALETWKTNSNYMVNRRFIVPSMTETRYGGGMEVRRWYSCRGYAEELEDVCKGLCFLTGQDYDKVGTLYSCVENTRPDWGTWFEWGFFRVRGYKKGTMHFEFIDEDTWYRFNQVVAEERGYSIGSKAHASQREREGRKQAKKS